MVEQAPKAWLEGFPFAAALFDASAPGIQIAANREAAKNGAAGS